MAPEERDAVEAGVPEFPDPDSVPEAPDRGQGFYPDLPSKDYRTELAGRPILIAEVQMMTSKAEFVEEGTEPRQYFLGLAKLLDTDEPFTFSCGAQAVVDTVKQAVTAAESAGETFPGIKGRIIQEPGKNYWVLAPVDEEPVA
jgi:hypothetical protein